MKRLFILILCIFTVSSVFPDDVKAELNKTRAYYGETLVYQISITTDYDIPPLDFIEIPDVNVEYLGNFPNYNVLIQNGKTFKQTINVETFSLTPQRTGNFTIPSFKLNIGGKVFKTKKISFTIEKPEKNRNYSLKINFNKTDIYTGETVIADFIWYYGNSAHSIQVRNPYIREGTIQDENLVFSFSPDEQEIAIMYNGDEIKAAYNQNEKYVRFKRRFIFNRADRVDASGFNLQFDGVSGYRDTFGGLRREAVYKTYVIPGEGGSVQSKLLPMAGQPDDFSGIVGKLEIEIKANPLEVQVGEPITLQIIFRGDIYNSFRFPDLSVQKELAENFSFPFSHSAPSDGDAELTFIQTIRPKNSNITEIPAVRLNYFDSKSGRYKDSISNTIPVSIMPVAVSSAGDMKINSRTEANSNPEINIKGIRYNYDISEITKDMRPDASGPGLAVLFLILLAALFGTFLFFWLRYVFLISGKNDKRSFSAAKGLNDTRSEFYRYLFTSLKIQKHSRIALLRKQINNSDKSEAWKEKIQQILDTLLNFRQNEKEKEAALKIMFDEAVKLDYSGRNK